MIDDLWDTIGGKRTVWAATDSFYRGVRLGSLATFMQRACNRVDSAQANQRGDMLVMQFSLVGWTHLHWVHPGGNP
jgi:hypothetical protein